MKRPSFQFYPGDWRSNAKLRRCSWEARGVWIEIICLMHDSDEYGILRWNLKEIAQAVGAPIRFIKELVEKGVIKGSDKAAEAFNWAPTHAGKKGDAVELIGSSQGPCWYSSRMVVDEHIRKRRGADSRFGGAPEQAPDYAPKGEPMSPPMPSPKGSMGDGPSSSSSSSLITPIVPNAVHGAPASPPLGRGKERKKALPTTPEAQCIAGIFHRRLDTPWDDAEVKAFKRAQPIRDADLRLVERYYAAHWPPRREVNVLRHDIKTLLNNFQGEVDRARSFAEQSDRAEEEIGAHGNRQLVHFKMVAA